MHQDAAATEAGKGLFAANCAVCHGQDAKGMGNFPNLTDNEWIYGGSVADIKETLMKGRNGELGNMPAWETMLGEDKVEVLSGYVYGLSQ
nr:c-type cytochrome [Ferrimonas senticii]